MRRATSTDRSVLPGYARRTAAFAAVIVCVIASPAAAHVLDAFTPTNYRSVVFGVVTAEEAEGVEGDRVSGSPLPEGVTWSVEGGDALLEVENTTDEELLVEGYESEPYLRIGPDGVFMNLNSPAAYLNNDRYAQTAMPERADPKADPEWVPYGSDPIYSWHDHRVHWMSPSLPPQVAQDQSKPVRVQFWEVPFAYAGERYVVEGELRWVPPPSPWPWLLGAAAVALAVVLAVVVLAAARKPTSERGPALVRATAVLIGGMAIASAVYVVGELLSGVEPGEGLMSVLRPFMFIAIAAWGSWRARNADEPGQIMLLFAAAGLAGLGLSSLDTLTVAPLGDGMPAWYGRAVTAGDLVVLLPAALAVGVTRLSDRREKGEPRRTQAKAPSS